MSLIASGLLGLVLLIILTAAVGGVLDLPSLATFRATLAERRVRPWALVVAASPGISAALDLPSKLAVASKLPIGLSTGISLIGGAFFTAAFTGCWLAMDEARDPHSRPKAAIIVACIVLAIDGVVLTYLRTW